MRGFSWGNMEPLVAGLLRSMGYRTHMTSKGAGGGHEIIAAPDEIGFSRPGIVTEIKNHQKQMNSEKARAFVSTLRDSVTGLRVLTVLHNSSQKTT